MIEARFLLSKLGHLKSMPRVLDLVVLNRLPEGRGELQSTLFAQRAGQVDAEGGV